MTSRVSGFTHACWEYALDKTWRPTKEAIAGEAADIVRRTGRNILPKRPDARAFGSVLDELGSFSRNMFGFGAQEFVIDFLTNAKVWIGHQDGLSDDQKQEIIGAIDTSIEAFNKVESDQGYGDAIRATIDSMRRFPILLNGIIEIPLPRQGQQENPVDDVTGMINSLRERLDRPAPALDIKGRLAQEKSRFKEGATFASTFSLVWKWWLKTPGSDETYARVLNRIREEGDREKGFLKVLRYEIDHRQDVMWLNKFFSKWVLLPLSYSFFSPIITLFSDGMSDFFEKEISQLSSEQHKKREEPVKRTTSFLINFKKALKTWAESESDDLDSFLETELDKPDYNQGMDAEQVRKKMAHVAIDKLMPPLVWTGPIDRIRTYLIDRSNSGALVFQAIKWSLTLPLHALLLTARALVMVTQGVVNLGLRFTIKRALGWMGIVEKMAVAAEESFYHRSQYTYAIDVAVLQQMKNIWELLNRESEEKTPAGVPPNLRRHVRRMLNTLMEVIDAQKHDTPPKMRHYLQSLENNTGNQLQTIIVDNLANVIVVAYQSFMQRDQMELQQLHFLEKVNEAMSQEHAPVEEDEAAQLAECRFVEGEIKRFRGLILKKVVSSAYEEWIRGLGEEDQVACNRFTSYLKTTFETKPNEWQRLLENDSIDELLASLLRTQQELRTNESETLSTIKERPKEYLTTKMLTDLHRHLKTVVDVANRLHIYHTEQQRWQSAGQPMRDMRKWYADIPAHLTAMQSDPDKAKEVQASILAIEITMENAQELMPDTFKEGLTLLKKGKSTLLNYPQIMRISTQLGRHLGEFTTLKKGEIAENRWFSSPPYKEKKKEITSLLNSLPYPPDKELFKSILQRVIDAKTSVEVDTAASFFIEALNRMKEIESRAIETFRNDVETLSNRIDQTSDDRGEEPENITAEAKAEALAALEAIQALRIEDVPFIKVPFLSIPLIVNYMKGHITSQLESTTEDLITLLRDSNFFRGASNHIMRAFIK